MAKPVVILDPHWRQMSELFSNESLSALKAQAEIIWGRDAPIPKDVYQAALPRAEVLIAADPRVTAETLAQAPKLRMVIEVSGAFPDTIDYVACAAGGVEVLSCAPGFRAAVAEMGLAMALAGGRGLITEHEAFRRGTEGWLQDNVATDFTLYRAPVAFIGFGQIAQEMARLMAPFAPRIMAFDPWLPEAVAAEYGITLGSMEEVLAHACCLFVTAAPTTENKGLIGAAELTQLRDNALVVVLSRAHLVDFDALTAEASSGRLRVATDVFPVEPAPQDHPIRSADNAILSPHRAAAVAGGRHLIGEMIVDDLAALVRGQDARRLTRADPARVALLSGVGDATQVADMAAERK